MKTLQEIQKEVGEWSLANFGEQETTHLAHRCADGITNCDVVSVCLGSLAPLLGIGEELGEMASALNEEDYQDALGDILVYLCDYASREGFDLVMPDYVKRQPSFGFLQEMRATVQDSNSPFIAYGKLLHATLKRHQGIRGFDDTVHYQNYRYEAVQELLIGLQRWPDGERLLEFLNTTWKKVVSKRNWKKNPGDGVQA